MHFSCKRTYQIPNGLKYTYLRLKKKKDLLKSNR